jgi:lysozyme family protein
MQTVTEIADEIIAREGGYVNDPDDPGGATKFGITIATLRGLGIDLDGDGTVTAGDVKRLTHAQARDIIIEHYFRRPQIDALPEALQATVFDMQVNAGAQAIRLLQRLLGELGEPVAIDGVIGLQTIGAARRAHEKAPDHVVDAYGIARRNYYYALADRRVSSRKYARRRDGGKGGWIKRAETFIAQRFHLTDEQHRERTSRWV